MNERIQELAEQATVSISYRVCQHTFKEIDDPAGPFVRKKFSKEKFAELIVRECARVARATPAPNFHEHLKQQLGHTWDVASIEAGREIVKHFGVEE
jgi:hypothetical protein